MTVAQLSECLSAAEEAHWIALYRLDPWGEQRDDMRSALIAQLIHNTNSKKGKKLKDFMLFTEKPSDRVNDPEILRAGFERMIQRQRK